MAQSPFALAADILHPRTANEWYLPNPDPNYRGDPARLYEYEGQTLIKERARPKQRPPDGDWFVWLLQMGRGWGKSRTASEYIDRQARLHQTGQQILIAGRTPADVNNFCLLGEGGLLTHHPDVKYEPSKRLLTWPNGATAIIRSGANAEEFRGYSGDLAWLDEFAAWSECKDAWTNLMMGVRERDPRVVITTTPRPIPILREISSAPTTVTVRGTTFENRANLSERWIETVVTPLMGTRLARQEIEAEYLEEAEGALWTRDQIEACRIRPADLPELARIVIGVDPQGTAGTGNTGIVVCAKGKDDRYYVAEDATVSGTPDQWGRRVDETFAAHAADLVVAERNFGGDMVEYVLRSINPALPVKIVTASRGKRQRAEPIQALYARGLVSHAGAFPYLEDQMATWSPGERWSPDRLDACLVSDTPIATPEGDKPIQDIVPGDLVWTRDGWGTVEATRVLSAPRTVTVELSNGERLQGTPDHRVLTPERGWVRLDSLVWGDVLVSPIPLEPHRVTVRVHRRYESSAATVYDLQVDKREFLASGVVVHNCVWAMSELAFGGKTSIILKPHWGTRRRFGGRESP